MNIDTLKFNLNKNGKIFFSLKILPGAKQTEWQDPLADGTLRLKVKAVPEKGRANDELISFLANIFEVNKKLVQIIAGNNTRLKKIKIIKL